MATYEAFDLIFNGTEEEAKEYVTGIDWSEIIINETYIANGRYVCTWYGIEIYYDFGAEYYFFTERECDDDDDEYDGQPDEAQEWHDFDPDC